MQRKTKKRKANTLNAFFFASSSSLAAPTTKDPESAANAANSNFPSNDAH